LTTAQTINGGDLAMRRRCFISGELEPGLAKPEMASVDAPFVVLDDASHPRRERDQRSRRGSVAK